VTSTTANGSYNAGDDIVVTTTFTEVLTVSTTAVTARPQLTLNTGDKSLSFDGSDDNIQLSTSSNLVAASNNLSIGAWVKVPTSNNKATPTVVGARSGYGYILYAGSTSHSGAARFDINTASDAFSNIVGTTDLRDNNWHYVSATYDGSTMKLYVDGALERSSSVSTSYLSGLDGSTAMKIGNGNHASEYFIGELDEVAIWNDVLSLSEIKSLYNSGAGMNASSSSPIKYSEA
jgi:hypothetical protein